VWVKWGNWKEKVESNKNRHWGCGWMGVCMCVLGTVGAIGLLKENVLEDGGKPVSWNEVKLV